MIVPIVAIVLIFASTWSAYFSTRDRWRVIGTIKMFLLLFLLLLPIFLLAAWNTVFGCSRSRRWWSHGTIWTATPTSFQLLFRFFLHWRYSTATTFLSSRRRRYSWWGGKRLILTIWSVRAVVGCCHRWCIRWKGVRRRYRHRFGNIGFFIIVVDSNRHRITIVVYQHFVIIVVACIAFVYKIIGIVRTFSFWAILTIRWHKCFSSSTTTSSTFLVRPLFAFLTISGLFLFEQDPPFLFGTILDA